MKKAGKKEHWWKDIKAEGTDDAFQTFGRTLTHKFQVIVTES